MIGTLIWGITNIGIGLASTFHQAAAFAGLNGVGLALVLPCVQSILAEVYPAGRRGLAFGLMMTAGVLGQTIFNYIAISFGDRIVYGIQGWRLVFHILAGLAGMTTALLFIFGLEPRTSSRRVQLSDKTGQRSRGRKPMNSHASLLNQMYSSIMAMFQDCKKLFMVPSFPIILLAEGIAAVGASGTGYQILYIETIGFTDNDTALLTVFFSLGYAVGMVTGGVVGDALAKHLPRYGRPSVNQFSIAVTAPLVAIYFKGLPGATHFSNGVPTHMHKYMALYSVVLFLVAIAAPMEQSNNAAMYAEVIPEELCCSAYAFDRGIFGLLGAISAPLAGILAKQVWGGNDLSLTQAPQPTSSEAQSFHALNIVNARALENANIAVIVGAIVLRAFVYSALYWTLPQDKQTLLKRKAAQSYANEVSELTGVELLHLQQGAFKKASHGRTYSFPGPRHDDRRDGSKTVRYASEPLSEHMHAPAFGC
ncbi:hypothetical protein CVIRNUC_004210 [Coccomyxa viridis]|uniref:Major facilitator superfamily (MFS) profile domain-containing protein n=1 Tax=Coccomyxa viridis TaxID=1274662 RepID=A0AAV1I3T6_9CHLO|nr:hypothetical protein CVIRNUC_004210 [Coccomyxa viridis]